MDRDLITRRRFLGSVAAASATVGRARDVAAQAGGGVATQTIGTVIVRGSRTSQWTDAALTTGFSAAKGVIAAGNTVAMYDGADEIPTQLDWFNAWSDGSLRFGVISALVPSLGAGQTKSLSIRNKSGPRNNTPAIDAAALADYLATQKPDAAIDWADRDGRRYTASANDALRGARTWSPDRPHLAGRWLSGPICTEWVCSAPLIGSEGKHHRSLRAWFHCRAYTANRRIVGARVDRVLDNGVGPYNPDTIDAFGDGFGRSGFVGSTTLTPDSAAGRMVNGWPTVVELTAGADVFEADHKFMWIDADGVIVQIHRVLGPRRVAGGIYFTPDLLAAEATLAAAGDLPLRFGALRLNTTHRLRIAGSGQDLRARTFTFHGAAPDGAAQSETLRGPAANGYAISARKYARVDRISVDGPTDGKVSIGTGHFATTAPIPAGAWRVHGMALAPYAKWPDRLSYGTVAEARPAPQMFIAARLLPNYSPALKSAGLSGYVAQCHARVVAESDSHGRLIPISREPEAPASRGLNVTLGGSSPGGRPDLAVVPGYQVPWVFESSDAAYSVMMAAGAVFHQYSYHFRDRDTGLCPDPGKDPGFSYYQAMPRRPPNYPLYANSVSIGGTDPEHWMEMSYLPFLVSGDLVHYETLYQSAFADWAWHPGEWPYQSGATGYERGIGMANARALAWSARSFGHVRAAGPDKLYDPGVTSPREIMDRIWARQQRWYTTLIERGVVSRYFDAPWMFDYLTATFGHLGELDVLSPDGKAYLDHIARMLVDFVGPANTNPAVAASWYYTMTKRADGSRFATIADVYKYMVDTEWPVPKDNFFVPQLLKSNSTLGLRGELTKIGATATAVLTGPSAPGMAGGFDERFVGRQIYALPDRGLATIVKLDNAKDGRSSEATLRIDAPFSKTSYKAGEWLRQFPASGQSRWSRLDHTQPTNERVYYTVGALGALAGAGMPGAKEAWDRLNGMLAVSGDEFTKRDAWWCCWAIAPRTT